MESRLALVVLAAFVIVVARLSPCTVNAQAQPSNCNQTDYAPVKHDESRPSTLLVCFGGGEWTKGSDLCDPTTFSEYPSCSGHNKILCEVPREDYLSEPVTFFRCSRSDGSSMYYQIIINAFVVDFSVPLLLRAGREESVYTIIKSKPRPSVFPNLTVEVHLSNSDDEFQNLTILQAPVQIVFRDSYPLEYIVVHSFIVPEEATSIDFQFHIPEDYTNITSLNSTVNFTAKVIPDIPSIVVSEVEVTTTQLVMESTTTTETTETTEVDTANTADEQVTVSTPATGGVSVVPTCTGSGAIAGAAVGGAFGASILAVVVMSFIFCCWYKSKKKNLLFKTTRTPTSLQLGPIKNGYSMSTPTSQNGFTPTSDDKALILSESGRYRTTSITVSGVNMGFRRLPSRGSTSPTTPSTDVDQPLMTHPLHTNANAASAASSPRNPKIYVSSSPTGTAGHGVTMEESCHRHDVAIRVSQVEGQRIREEDEEDEDEVTMTHIYSRVHDPTGQKEFVSPLQKRPLPPTPPPDAPLHSGGGFISGAAGEEIMEPGYISQGIGMTLPPQALGPQPESNV